MSWLDRHSASQLKQDHADETSAHILLVRSCRANKDSEARTYLVERHAVYRLLGVLELMAESVDETKQVQTVIGG